MSPSPTPPEVSHDFRDGLRAAFHSRPSHRHYRSAERQQCKRCCCNHCPAPLPSRSHRRGARLLGERWSGRPREKPASHRPSASPTRPRASRFRSANGWLSTARPRSRGASIRTDGVGCRERGPRQAAPLRPSRWPIGYRHRPKSGCGRASRTRPVKRTESQI